VFAFDVERCDETNVMSLVYDKLTEQPIHSSVIYVYLRRYVWARSARGDVREHSQVYVTTQSLSNLYVSSESE
jgi:predicted nucleotidyltransferase